MKPILARRPTICDEHGVSPLASIVLLVVLLLSLGAGTLLMTNIDLQSSSHYRSGRQAFFAAESGILHALSTINGRGVINFQTDIAAPAQWTRLYGNSTKTLPSDPVVSYQVVVAANAADPLNRGTITATGFADLQAQAVITIDLKKGIRTAPGALYLAADNVDPDFGARDQFLIDGNDHTLQGNLNPAGEQRPGIATRNDDVTEAAIAELSDPQKQRVQGVGFSTNPLKPSVQTVEGPSVSDMEQIISHLLTNNPVTRVNNPVLAAGTYGTLEAPQITHLTNRDVQLNGTLEGVGVLIADGSFTINGDANFLGWMLIRGSTVLNRNADTLVDGNATILGSLWTGDLVVQVGGAALIEYCEACMALADRIGIGNNVPRTMHVSAWQEEL